MKYYILHNSQPVFFDFSLAGFMAAVAYVEEHGLGHRKLYATY